MLFANKNQIKTIFGLMDGYSEIIHGNHTSRELISKVQNFIDRIRLVNHLNTQFCSVLNETHDSVAINYSHAYRLPYYLILYLFSIFLFI